MVIVTFDVLDTLNITFKQGQAINTAGGFKCCSVNKGEEFGAYAEIGKKSKISFICWFLQCISNSQIEKLYLTNEEIDKLQNRAY